MEYIHKNTSILIAYTIQRHMEVKVILHQRFGLLFYVSFRFFCKGIN
jgi:hypothetical protein